MVSPRAAGTPPPLRAVGKGPWGTFIYGTSRPLVQWLAQAMAAAYEPNPVWVDFRDADVGPDPSGPVALGAVPEDRLYVVTRSEAKPGPAVTDRTLWTVIRSDEPKDTIAELTYFLRLPPRAQEIVSRAGGKAPRLALVVANSDRVRDFYPRYGQLIRALIDSTIRAHLLPFFASLPPTDPGYLSFDLVFEVRAKGLTEWREGTLRCEKAPADSEFVSGQTSPLGSLPELASLLDGRRP